MILDSPEVPAELLERETGWVLKPEGACRGALCVPIGSAPVTPEIIADRLGMGVVHDERHRLSAIGPSTVSGRALESVEAPEFTLPDLDGRPFEFRSLRGQKVVLIAWASW